MLKKIIATTLVATALMFSGCGDQAGEDFLAAQHSIDEGDYASAIALLEDVNASDRTDAQNVMMANAYMGEAGFTTLDIVTLLATDSATDPLTAMIDPNATAEENAAKLANIELAIEALQQVTVADGSAATVDELGDNELTLGLAYVAKTSLLLNDPASDDQNVADTVNDAVDFVIAVGNQDIKDSIADMKLESFNVATGDITASDIAYYDSL